MLVRPALARVVGIAVGLLASSLASNSWSADCADIKLPELSSAAFKTAVQKFEEGKTHWIAGRYLEACSLFAESRAHQPMVVNLLNMGRCHDRRGLTASAWRFFKQAKRLAVCLGDDRISLAQEQLDKIEPRLAYMKVVIREPVEGLVVRLNGVKLDPARLAAPQPIDPREHTVTASAPGRLPWAGTLKVYESERRVVEVPPLPLDPSAAQKAATPPTEPVTPLLTTAGYAVGAVGAAALVASAVAGGLAWRDQSNGDESCPNHSCSPDGLALIDAARSKAVVSNVMMGVGVPVLLGGAAMVAIGEVVIRGAKPKDDRKPAEPSSTVLPLVGPDRFGLSVLGAW